MTGTQVGVLDFTSVQLENEGNLLELYSKRQLTVSEHQQEIINYLRLRHFVEAEAALLEKVMFEGSCRLEQAAALQIRAQEFLKVHGILEPGEFRISRIVG